MNKKTIIDDNSMYVKLRESGLKTDIYFNRKENNPCRGHFVLIGSDVVFNRPAPNLSVGLSGGIVCLNISGSMIVPLKGIS